MKILLDWKSFNQYKEFASRELILENEGDDANMKKARIKTSYAFTILTGRYRFFAELAYKLKIIYTRHPEIQTAAVDGTHLFINPDFFAPLTEKEIVFILCHEVLHCALLHFARMEGRNPKKWNYATDYEINLMLVEDGILTQAEVNALQGLLNTKYKGMNAEQIYDDPELENPPNQDKPDQKQKGQGGGGGEQPLAVGDIVRNERTGGYGIVKSIDETSGEVDYDPISKEEAIKIVNG